MFLVIFLFTHILATYVFLYLKIIAWHNGLHLGHFHQQEYLEHSIIRKLQIKVPRHQTFVSLIVDANKKCTLAMAVVATCFFLTHLWRWISPAPQRKYRDLHTNHSLLFILLPRQTCYLVIGACLCSVLTCNSV